MGSFEPKSKIVGPRAVLRRDEPIRDAQRESQGKHGLAPLHGPVIITVPSEQ